MNRYKKILCPDCQTTLGKILPLEYGQLSLELHCKKCKASKKIHVEVRTSTAMRASANGSPATERIFVG
jgi:phage FluMu protein Com